MAQFPASLIDDESDYRAWIAVQRVQNLRPPYPPDFQVTPLSRFEDPWWDYPPEWLPAGHRSKPRIDFGTNRAVADGNRFALSAATHPLLIQQLKEVLVAMIYFRNLLPGRIDAAKPLTIMRDAMRLSQLFTNFAAAGVTTLRELTQNRLSEAFGTLPIEPKAHLLMIGHLRDIILLSERGLISDALVVPDASIEIRDASR